MNVGPHIPPDGPLSPRRPGACLLSARRSYHARAVRAFFCCTCFLLLSGCANVTTTSLRIQADKLLVELSSGKGVQWERAEYDPRTGRVIIIGYRAAADPAVVSAQGAREAALVRAAAEGTGQAVGVALKSSGVLPPMP